jgi:hypothetical protein
MSAYREQAVEIIKELSAISPFAKDALSKIEQGDYKGAALGMYENCKDEKIAMLLADLIL